MISARILGRNTTRLLACTVAAASLTITSAAHAELVAQWVADDYKTATNWVDRVGKIAATQQNSPAAVPNAFNGHAGVQLNPTGVSQAQYFTVSQASDGQGKLLSNAKSFTLVAVFKPSADGAEGGQFYQASGLIGNEQPGVVNDWGMGWGKDTDNKILAGLGDDGGADNTIESEAQETGKPTVAIMIWNSTGGEDGKGVMTLYVNGKQVARSKSASNQPRRDGDDIGLGAVTGGGDNPLQGTIAELRIYDDARQDAAALTKSLQETYVGK